ncbi:MAG: hypothetical protein FJ088_01960, partial [Deltaproteobacteria bacterium]|nr:hypothetical protein [Deltaproteobacteria bacterium]
MFFREAVRYPVLFAAFLLLAASCGGESTTSIEVDVANADFIEDTAGEGFDAISDAPDAIEDFSETKIDAENDIPADIEIITDMMEAKETDAKDVKEETVLPAKKIYRISQMSVKNPKFCFDVNNQCLDITTQVNTYIDQSLNDLEEPMNILLFFDPFHPGGLKPSVLKLGEGVCKIENQTITACKLSEFGNPAVFEDVVVKPDIMSSLCHDKPQIIPACFVTEEKAMELYFMDIFISFKEGYIAP